MSAVALAALALITELIKDSPAIIAEIESLIANAKREAAGGDPPAPIAPKVEADTAALAKALGAP